MARVLQTLLGDYGVRINLASGSLLHRIEVEITLELTHGGPFYSSL